ncbi:MAG: carbohydrate ABC transporter permease [Aestuariivirga sp.]
MTNEAKNAPAAVQNSGRLDVGRAAYFFVGPAMLLFATFVLSPLVASFYYAFTNWDGYAEPSFVGLSNFKRAIQDTTYLLSYLHVILYIIGTLFFEVLFGLLMAVLLDSDRRGFGILRGMFFSPMVLSMTAAGVLFAFVLDYRSGLLNQALRGIGLDDLAQPWLSQPSTALVSIMLVSGWKFSGFYMVIFLAALRRIPRNLYEAASLDGATRLQQLLRITFPLLKQNILTCVLLAVTGGFAGFDLFFTLTNGQPFGATEVPATWIIKTAFDGNEIGYATALTVIYATVVIGMSLLFMRFSERVDAAKY